MSPAWVAAFFGVAGPLAVAAVSWLLMVRTHRRNPAALTGLMSISTNEISQHRRMVPPLHSMAEARRCYAAALLVVM